LTDDDEPPKPYSFEWYRQKALADEADGKCVVMRDPKIKPKPPKRPSLWRFFDVSFYR
jgi:hypothetical protein